MFGKRFKILVLLAALLHLADRVLVELGHDHCPAHAAAHAGHDHESDAAAHDHGNDELASAAVVSAADDAPGSHEHCAACRHLAQSASHHFVLVELPTAERVAPLCTHLPRLDLSRAFVLHHSRGPPESAL